MALNLENTDNMNTLFITTNQNGNQNTIGCFLSNSKFQINLNEIKSDTIIYFLKIENDDFDKLVYPVLDVKGNFENFNDLLLIDIESNIIYSCSKILINNNNSIFANNLITIYQKIFKI